MKASKDKRYFRDGKQCIMCQVRKKLILKTPEEQVRQNTIKFLVETLKVPLDKIEVEVPLTYFKKGAKGRADIIVNGKDEEGYLVALMIIECKAPKVLITDDVFEQAVRYDDIIQANTIMLTNGVKMEFERWVEEEQSYFPLEDLPTYNDLLYQKNLNVDKSPRPTWKRPLFSSIQQQQVINEFFDKGWLGEDTKKDLYPFVVNLGGCLQDDSKKLQPQSSYGIKVVRDGGIRFTSFGNVAGGRWSGEYRFFILQDEKGNNQIISLGIFGQAKSKNDPRFGNSRGNTILIVAIDDFETSHNSLQLNLDINTQISNNSFTIYHDGRLTVGNKGAVPTKKVIEFVKTEEPDLIRDDKVYLGEFDCTTEIDIEDEQTKYFLFRLIRYALIRDDFRRTYIMN